ncbi:bacillithiol biosynthesis BshC [bacterium]|nr:bacillithiol biosynthesis BshC [candidate division CSSED10-310 bacterium]
MKAIKLKTLSCPYRNIPDYAANKLLIDLESNALNKSFPLFSLNTPLLSSHSEFLNRSELAEILISYNKSIGNPLSKIQTDAILSSGRFIVAGQQPGLLTGPIYTILKVISVLILSEIIQSKSDDPILPAFWIASEDHDILEVNRCTISGQQLICNYRDTLETDTIPCVGFIPLDNCRDSILKFLSSVLPASEHKDWVMSIVAECSFESYSVMFASLLGKLFKSGKLILIDAVSLHPLMKPVIEKAIACWSDLENAFNEGSNSLKSYGYDTPLESLNLFEIVDKKRCKMDMSKVQKNIKQAEFSNSTCDDIFDSRQYSPGAALRLICQDAVIPVLVTVGGPTELLYQWQISPLYNVLSVRRSALFPRISATFIEDRIRHSANCWNLYPDGIFTSLELLENYPGTVDLPDEYQSIKISGDRLITEIRHVFKDDRPPWMNKIENSLSYQLNKLYGRLTDEHLSSQGKGRAELEKIAGAVYPRRNLQEREVNIFHFLGRYGPQFLDQLLDVFDPFLFGHTIVEIKNDGED